MTLGEMIRAGMDDRGISAPQLANATFMRRSITVYDWTSNKSTPAPDTLGLICTALGLDSDRAARAAYPDVFALAERQIDPGRIRSIMKPLAEGISPSELADVAAIRATLTRRGAGWAARLDVTGEDGQRVKRSRSGFASAEDALDWLGAEGAP